MNDTAVAQRRGHNQSQIYHESWMMRQPRRTYSTCDDFTEILNLKWRSKIIPLWWRLHCIHTGTGYNSLFLLAFVINNDFTGFLPTKAFSQSTRTWIMNDTTAATYGAYNSTCDDFTEIVNLKWLSKVTPLWWRLHCIYTDAGYNSLFLLAYLFLTMISPALFLRRHTHNLSRIMNDTTAATYGAYNRKCDNFTEVRT